MIDEALRHFPGIGPVRLAELQDAGVRSWDDVLRSTEWLPNAHREQIVDEARRCLTALERTDIEYFVERFTPRDRWRILDRYLECASFFDIETSGLSVDARVTVIVCWHRGQLYEFVEHENLDEFLDLLDEMQLVISFNGSTFDVPRLLDTFHIPAFPCPHLDLRWICFHRGWTGSLKEIADELVLGRPNDLSDVDGAVAVDLWESWMVRGNRSDRDLLLRYCAADVVTLVALAQRLSPSSGILDEAVWATLPDDVESTGKRTSGDHQAPPAPAFVKGTPKRLRALRRNRM